MELNIADIFEALADAYPERSAIVFRDRDLTYRRVAQRAGRLAASMHAAGLGRRSEDEPEHGWLSPHDHVALYLYNGNEYLEAMLGAYMCRAAPININYRYKADELRYVLEDSRAAGIVFHGAFADQLEHVLSTIPRPPWLCQVADESGAELLDGAVWFHDVVDAPPSADGKSTDHRSAVPAERSGSDRYICYTGGTTGMPKGVLWRQDDFLVAALGVHRRDGSAFESMSEIVADAAATRLRAVPTPPLMHGAAHWNALSCWIAGGTVICQSHPEHLDPHDVWSTVDRHRATSLLVVGDSFALPLLEQLDRSSYDVSSLRHILSGGAVLSPTVRERLLEALPGVVVVDVLGSSESGRQGVARSSAESGLDEGFRPSSTAVLLSEDRTRRLTADEGDIGWLAQSGRVPLGYLGDAAKSEATFPTLGGVRYAVAGDRARYGSDGRIILLGRESVCINTGGEKVFAEEVEVALTSHPAVRDAIVCGRPSQRWGSEVVAVVSLEAGSEVGDGDLIAHCKNLLASFKAPQAIIRCDSVVRSPSGKADYAWARHMVSESRPDENE